MTTFSPASGTHGAHRCLASRLLACAITNGKDEAVGTIEDLVLEVRGRRIAYAVVSFGGAPGLDSKYFAMPWQLIDVGHADKRNAGGASMRASMNIARETLLASPGFDKDHWPETADGRWSARLDAHYRPGPAVASSDAFDANGRKRIAAGRAQERPTADEDLGHRRLRRVLGMEVVDSQYQTLSSVGDVILDVRRGTIDGLVLSLGRGPGVGERVVLVPADSVSFDADDGVFVLPSSRERLQTMAIRLGAWPPLDSDDWLLGGRERLATPGDRAAPGG